VVASLFDSFSKLKPVNVALFGDLMLDRYTTGNARRVSPEAPVLVLQGEQSEDLPGGAGNVALNLISMGAKVEVVGRIGRDVEGKLLAKLLKETGAAIDHLVVQNDYPTTLKHRVIADAHHLLRIDRESVEVLDSATEERLIKKLPKLLTGKDAVAISDYGKGFLSRALTSAIISAANEKKIPVFVDPKGDDFTKYTDATLIKPNEKEAYEAAKRNSSIPIHEVGKTLLEQTSAQHILVTRSAKGMTLFSQNISPQDFPIKAQKVSDVTGAGDAVLAMITLGMASGLPLDDTIKLANIAGCIAVSTLGCTSVTLSDIAEKMLLEHQESKVFTDDHAYALEQALKGKEVEVLTLEPHQEMTTELFAHLQKMEREEKRLVLYAKDRQKDDPLLALLSHFRCIQFITLKEFDFLACPAKA